MRPEAVFTDRWSGRCRGGRHYRTGGSYLTSEGFVGSNPTAPTIAHQHKRAVWTARSEGLLSWPVVENKASSLRAAAALRVAGLCLCEAEQRRCGASHRALRAASQERGLGFGPRPWPGLARSVPARMVRVMPGTDSRCRAISAAAGAGGDHQILPGDPAPHPGPGMARRGWSSAPTRTGPSGRRRPAAPRPAPAHAAHPAAGAASPARRPAGPPGPWWSPGAPAR
jgi:hypothetical protein